MINNNEKIKIADVFELPITVVNNVLYSSFFNEWKINIFWDITLKNVFLYQINIFNYLLIFILY
jgi:hypothetical protein